MQADMAFHRVVIASTGNETLTSLLDGLSGRTVRARVWRGLVEGNVTQVTIDEHRAIYLALLARDPSLASRRGPPARQHLGVVAAGSPQGLTSATYILCLRRRRLARSLEIWLC